MSFVIRMKIQVMNDQLGMRPINIRNFIHDTPTDQTPYILT